MPSVLLLEFIVSEHFPRAVTFPFIQGYLKARGAAARWLRFALRHAVRAGPGLPGFSLPPEDLEALPRLVGASPPPTHVLVSHEPAPDLLDALHRVAPGARVGWVCDQAPTGGHPSSLEPVFPDIPSIATFFDLSHEGPVNLFEEADPDFSFDAANALAASAPPLPFLMCGPDCTYRRSLASNPFFRGVDLSGCDDRGGCTFCLRPVRDLRWTRPIEEVMSRQLDAVARFWRGARERLLVRAIGETFLKRIETLAALAAVRPLPPCDFLLDGRADLLTARQSHVEDALRILQPTPHRIHIALVGIENFSDTELLRMNKGTTGLKNIDLSRMLLRLEREYPTTFAFRQWGGLSLILFTPWTRPQDLAFNLSVIETGRLETFCGKVFSGRLRLMPGLPLYRLAEHDGLLRSDYEDARLDTTRSNPYASLYPQETPWRFADPRMESVCRVIVRMASPPVPDDPIDAAMNRAFRRLGEESCGIGFALGVVDAAVAADGPVDPIALVDATLKLRGIEGRDWIHRDHTLPGVHMDPLLAVRFTTMAVRAGVKPVARLEGDAAEVGIAHASGLVSARAQIGERSCVFIGRDATSVEAAILAARRQKEPAGADDPGRCDAALLAEGRLLGYPECCVRAFAAQEGTIRDQYLWLHILRRVETEGEVSPLFHPGYLPLVEHLPCSLRCEESLDRAKRLLQAWRREKGEAAARELVETVRHPWLFLTEGEGNQVELIPEDEPSERFRYRPGLWAGNHPLIRFILEGDEAVLDDTGLSILRQGRLRVALGCRAFLWWYRRVFHRDLWRGLIALRFDPRREPEREETREAARPEDPVAVEKARRLAAFVAGALLKDQNDFEGFRISTIEPWSGLAVRLSLKSQRERMTLLIEPSDQSRPAFERVGPLALLHPDGAPLDTPAKVRAARRVAARLKVALVRRRRGRRSVQC